MTSRLEEQLQELHRQLAETQSVDSQSKAALTRLLTDINRLLGAKKVAPPESFIEVLEALEVRFEADHPALAATVRQLINTLAAAGI
jgi:thioredoxin-like negative regulator of GroEL